jgi:hypothetical protein
MAASEGVTALIDQLVTLFNERSMDLPERAFTRNTQFVLNGVPFEEMLSRSPQDPLVLMLARGAAGYRFTAKAVQHAVPDATLARGELQVSDDADGRVVRGQCWLSGHYRGTGAPIELLVDVELRLSGETIQRAQVRVDPELVTRLQEARLRA